MMTSHHHKMTLINNRSNTGAAGELETFAMANCLMLMNNQQATSVPTRGGDDVSRWFPCKTCGRKFSSFQALGGHRASHKKIKPLLTDEGIITEMKWNISSEKANTHVCRICGAEFQIGQALGGHMRRHRQTPVSGGGSTLTVENSEISSGGDHKRKVIEDEVNNNVVVVPNLNKSSSGKRVCLDNLDLDLNLYLWSHQNDR